MPVPWHTHKLHGSIVTNHQQLVIGPQVHDLGRDGSITVVAEIKKIGYMDRGSSRMIVASSMIHKGKVEVARRCNCNRN